MKRTPAVARPRKNAGAAYRHFGFRRDPFTTRALRPHDLSYFVGREREAERLAASLFALHPIGLAGEPGSGKSSLLHLVRERVPREFFAVGIGVPKDDPAYFLAELLRESLLVLPRKKVPFAAGWERRLLSGELGKNELLAMVKRLVAASPRPLLVFADDLEKIPGDRVAHFTRSERTLQVLEELKEVFELPRLAFAVSLQEEFHAKVRDVVREGADPTVLGLFKTVVRLEPFTQGELRRVLEARLRGAGAGRNAEELFEREALQLALSLSHGNPRRFLFMISEAFDRAFFRRAGSVEFLDLFEAVNEHLRLDGVCRKLLYFLAKSGRAMAANGDLQAFLGLDAVSINRRLEVLVKNRLAERLDVSGGSFVYGLPGASAHPATRPEASSLGRSVSFKEEKMFLLDEGEGS